MSRWSVLVLGLAGCAGSGLGGLGEYGGWQQPAFRADHSDLFAAQGEELRFELDVAENSTLLYVAMRGGSGDADLRVEEPDGSLLCSSEQDRSEEQCVIWDPPAGPISVIVSAFTDFEGVQLDFEIVSEDGDVVDPVVPAEPIALLELDSSAGNVEGSVRLTSRHGVLSAVGTAADPDEEFTVWIGHVADFGTGTANTEWAYPETGSIDIETTRMSGGSVTVYWEPLPMLIDEHIEVGGQTSVERTITVPDGFERGLIEVHGEGYPRITLSRAGVVLCSGRSCALDDIVPGELQLSVRSSWGDAHVQMSVDSRP